MIKNTIILLVIIANLTACNFQGFKITNIEYNSTTYQLEGGALAAKFILNPITPLSSNPPAVHIDPIDDELNQQLGSFEFVPGDYLYGYE